MGLHDAFMVAPSNGFSLYPSGSIVFPSDWQLFRGHNRYLSPSAKLPTLSCEAKAASGHGNLLDASFMSLRIIQIDIGFESFGD